jgi:hypothetical protein
MCGENVVDEVVGMGGKILMLRLIADVDVVQCLSSWSEAHIAIWLLKRLGVFDCDGDWGLRYCRVQS